MLVVQILLFLVFLLPPLFLARATVHWHIRSGWQGWKSGMTTTTIVVMLGLLFNLAFILIHLGEIASLQLQFKWPVIVALIISWCSFWARMALKPLERLSRRAH